MVKAAQYILLLFLLVLAEYNPAFVEESTFSEEYIWTLCFSLALLLLISLCCLRYSKGKRSYQVVLYGVQVLFVFCAAQLALYFVRWELMIYGNSGQGVASITIFFNNVIYYLNRWVLPLCAGIWLFIKSLRMPETGGETAKSAESPKNPARNRAYNILWPVIISALWVWHFLIPYQTSKIRGLRAFFELGPIGFFYKAVADLFFALSHVLESCWGYSLVGIEFEGILLFLSVFTVLKTIAPYIKNKKDIKLPQN